MKSQLLWPGLVASASSLRNQQLEEFLIFFEEKKNTAGIKTENPVQKYFQPNRKIFDLKIADFEKFPVEWVFWKIRN